MPLVTGLDLAPRKDLRVANSGRAAIVVEIVELGAIEPFPEPAPKFVMRRVIVPSVCRCSESYQEAH
jgi:hypothetical protein